MVEQWPLAGDIATPKVGYLWNFQASEIDVRPCTNATASNHESLVASRGVEGHAYEHDCDEHGEVQR